MVSIRSWIWEASTPARDRAKSALDRRYVSRDEHAEVLQRLTAVEESLDSIRTALLDPPTGGTSDSGGQRHVGDIFVGLEDPNKLRIKLFDAHRLAIESAKSVESLLETELKIWQAIDTIEYARTGQPLDQA